MEADFWKARWEEGQIGFHQDRANDYLVRHWPALGVPAGARVLVPMCGKSKDMLWLRAQGYPVLGVELSPIAVDAFFAENNLSLSRSSEGKFERASADGCELLCGDFFDLAKRDCEGVLAVYDRASLIALPVEMRERYARHLAGLLDPGDQVLLITMEYPQYEMDGPPFSVHEEDVRRLYEPAFEVRLLGAVDVLAENARFRDRGVSALHEKTYALKRRECLRSVPWTI